MIPHHWGFSLTFQTVFQTNGDIRLPEFPKEIKKGSVSVKIYSTPSKGYPLYSLAYYQEGRRKREYEADYSVILKRADEVLDDLIEARPADGAVHRPYQEQCQAAPDFSG